MRKDKYMSGGKYSEMQGKRIETKGHHGFVCLFIILTRWYVYWFLERGKGKRERNIDVIRRLPPLSSATGGLKSQGRHVP